MIVGLTILVAVVLYAFYRFDIGTKLDALNDPDRATPGALLFVPLVGPVLQSFLIGFAFRRQNWARVSLAVLFALSVIATGLSEYLLSRVLPAGATSRPAFGATAFFLALFALRGSAIGLLFTPTANIWFTRGQA